MLREFQVTKDKPANSMFKSGEDVLITGMGVVKNETAKTADFADAETAADIYLVDLEKVAKGANAAKTNMSDYDEDFTVVKEGEFVKLIAYYPGEIFGTDQFVKTGLTENDRMTVNTSGKWIKATTGNSKYVFVGFFNDNGHELAKIKVSDTPAANA